MSHDDSVKILTSLFRASNEARPVLLLALSAEATATAPKCTIGTHGDMHPPATKDVRAKSRGNGYFIGLVDIGASGGIGIRPRTILC